MITLRDIATQTGVSIAAVSLVLNGRDAGRVSPETAERIRRVADEAGYAPNLSARGLKTRQTRTIGLLSDGVASIPFAGQMLAGAQTAAWEEGYLLLLIDTAGNDDLGAPAVRSLLQRNVEGLIVAVQYHREVDLGLVPPSVPTVVLNGRSTDDSDDARGADWVVPDEAGGGSAATRHLVEAGHRRIALCNLSAPAFVIAERLRRAGYESALAEAGIPLDPSLVVEAAAPSAEAGRVAAEEVLRRPDRPTAVFCVSDRIAVGFYQAAARLGLEIPRDLSVVGFDNQADVADSILPGLTTVQLPHRDLGVWAAKQAVRRAQGNAGEAPVQELIACPLVERASVAAPC